MDILTTVVTTGSTAAAGPAGHAATVGRAIKASGAIVRVEPDDFLAVLRRQQAPLVIHAVSGFLGQKHRYLSAYKGLTFFTESQGSLTLPSDAELIESTKIWIPA